MREQLKKALAGALQKAGISVAGEQIIIEHTNDLKNGDYATGVALAYAKQAGRSSRALAEEVVAALGRSPTGETLGAVDGISKIEIAGPGFINFYLASAFFAAAIKKANAAAGKWGKNTMLAGKRIMVEYTDPNPFKEFHIGLIN